jgi:hypothetical protein
MYKKTHVGDGKNNQREIVVRKPNNVFFLDLVLTQYKIICHTLYLEKITVFSCVRKTNPRSVTLIDP